MKTEVGVRGFFYFFLLFSPLKGAKRALQSTMEVEDGEDGASAGRGEGGADAPAAAPAQPASASAITAIVLALGDASASVERLFSVADQVVTAKRARLDPSTVTLLYFYMRPFRGYQERVL
jgi:hypothetical protein